MLIDMINIFDIGTSQIGIVAGIYSLGFAVSGVIASVLFTQYNYLFISMLGALFIFVGLLTYLLPSLGVISVIIARLLIGVGADICVPYYLKVLADESKDINESKNLLSYITFSTMGVGFGIFYFFQPLYNVMFDYYMLVKMFLLGACTGYRVLMMGEAIKIFSKQLAVFALTLSNAFAVSSGLIYNMVIGVLLDFSSIYFDEKMSYIIVLSFLVICLLVNIFLCIRYGKEVFLSIIK